MGKRLTPLTGKFVFKAKPNDRGERTLYIQYVFNSTAVYRSTNIRIREEDWNADRMSVKAAHPDHERINRTLHQLRLQTDTALAQYEGTINLSVIKDVLNGKALDAPSKKNVAFINYSHDLYKRRYESQEITFKTFQNAESILKRISIFLDAEYHNRELPIDKFDRELIDKLKAYYVREGNKRQSINKKLEVIRVTLSYAALNDIIPQSSILAVDKAKYQERETRYTGDIDDKEVHFLTEMQLKGLVDLYPTLKYDRTREFAEMFLFSFHACGLRVSDIVTLEWKHVSIEKMELKKMLVKTKNMNTIPLSEPAVRILMKWKERARNKRFVFDLLPSDFDLANNEKLSIIINNKNRVIRQSLVEIGNKLALPFPLTMHVARHTFAVMALNKQGISVHLISRLMGHSSVLVTEKVYAKFLDTYLTKEVKDKLSFTPFGLPSD